jgi:hypothetical protein
MVTDRSALWICSRRQIALGLLTGRHTAPTFVAAPPALVEAISTAATSVARSPSTAVARGVVVSSTSEVIQACSSRRYASWKWFHSQLQDGKAAIEEPGKWMAQRDGTPVTHPTATQNQPDRSSQTR